MGVDRRFRIARLWSNREIRRIAPLFTGEVVNVSAWDDRDKEGGHYENYFSKASSYHYTNYSGVRGYQGHKNEYFLDLTSELPQQLYQRFDVVLNHTTLEHIYDVKRGFKNLCDMTRDIVIIVVPFSQVQHETESYQDYWRFTPSCLREMFSENGMQVVYEAESTATNAAVYLLAVGTRNPHKWKDKIPKYKPLAEVGKSIGAKCSLTNLIQKMLRKF